ncbi:MAG: sugar phosphate isomerase/epimerase [Pirellulales bacterium]
MNHAERSLSRREFTSLIASAGSALAFPSVVQADDAPKFKPRYILASCMYGYLKLAEIVPEVREIGATAIDIWPKVHGNQREQLDEMGETAFTALLNKHNIALGCITQYKLGPFGLRKEMQLARRLGCRTMVTGGQGPKGLQGGELKSAMAGFVEKMKPHLAVAEENHVTIAIENHSHNLVDSPDALKWLAELRPSKHLGIALAPYHLPQNERLLADLIRSLGDSIAVFYAWQHGMGCMKKLPKEQELLQMPGRGPLDFAPLLSALQDIHYRGWTEIFMHPVPRGIPILQTATAVSAEINRSRAYLAGCLKTL